MHREFAASLLMLSWAGALAVRSSPQPAPAPPTFYRDVLPILQQHCQSCHRAGEIAPMPLVTYAQARAYAQAIAQQAQARTMPPWFADPCCGKFSDDPSLTAEQIATLAKWVEAKSPGGDPKD